MKYISLVFAGVMLSATVSFGQVKRHRHKHKTGAAKPVSPAIKPISGPPQPANPGTGTPKTKVAPPAKH